MTKILWLREIYFPLTNSYYCENLSKTKKILSLDTRADFTRK